MTTLDFDVYYNKCLDLYEKENTPKSQQYSQDSIINDDNLF